MNAGALPEIQWSQVIQWLRICLQWKRFADLIPGQGTKTPHTTGPLRSHVPQWKIPHDGTKLHVLQLGHNTAKYIRTDRLKKDQGLACTEPILKSVTGAPVKGQVKGLYSSEGWCKQWHCLCKCDQESGVPWRKAGAYIHRWGGKPLVLAARLLWSNIRTPYRVLTSHLLFMSHLLPKGCDMAFSEKQ